jgi:thiol-disulfide isomerase/thioredoxin
MNTLKVVLLGVFAWSSALLSAQGIEFFHGSWAEAKAKAKAEGKIIFVDAYAAWCGPCKRMASTVFTQESVGNYFNTNFVNLKIDMEKPENMEFASKYPVSAYPTLMFLDSTGKVIQKVVGAKDEKGLLDFGQKTLGRADKSGDYEKMYNEGNRDPQFLFDYIKSLNASGKPSLKITNEYLNGQKDLNTDFNLRFILEGATESDSRVFDLLMKNRPQITKIAGENAVNTRIEKSCGNTVKKAVEFKDEKLLNDAKTKLKTALPARSNDFVYDADTKYYAAVKDVKKYLAAVKAYQKSEIKNNAAKLHDLCIKIVRAFPEDTKALKQAEEWAKDAAETGGLPEYYMTLAEVYKRQGEKAKAKTTAQKARKAVGPEDKQNMGGKIDYFIQSLEG